MDLNQRTAVEVREEVLRPSRVLGYNRDVMGVYLVSRGAWEIAESQFRRAIWVNPFEPRFKVHLAWCLYKQNKIDEAKSCLAGLAEKEVAESERPHYRRILHDGSGTQVYD